MEKGLQLQEVCRGHSGHLPVQCAASPHPCGCGEPQISLVRAQAEPAGATSGPTAGAEAANSTAPSPWPAQGLEGVCLPAGPSLLPADWATTLWWMQWEGNQSDTHTDAVT